MKIVLGLKELKQSYEHSAGTEIVKVELWTQHWDWKS